MRLGATGSEDMRGDARAEGGDSAQAGPATGGAGAPGRDGLVRLRLRYVGQVQGVGFRWTARENARALGLTGWVRNMDDGSVTMELQGPYGDVQRFFSRMLASYRRYPIRYTIDERDEIAPVPGEQEFVVRL